MAVLMGMSVSGYRRWEQRTRRVSGPAETLLRVPGARARPVGVGIPGRRPSAARDGCGQPNHPEPTPVRGVAQWRICRLGNLFENVVFESCITDDLAVQFQPVED